ncbi:MAG: hypothetical protein KAT39_13075 [Alphaproteobacteria bacterium]|nr:hypothetical protein [Alphaproteobacteria bacterium]
MALSKCPHCNNTSFEAAEVSPSGSPFSAIFIQCAGCGAPVGVMDFYNIGTFLNLQETKIAELSQKIDRLEHSIKEIAGQDASILEFPGPDT